MTSLDLRHNQLETLPPGIFDNLTTLTSLNLSSNRLNSLSAGVFDELTHLTSLNLMENGLTSLPAGVFDELTSLTNLKLLFNNFNALPAGVFDELTLLTELTVSGKYTALPPDIFDNLTALTDLTLRDSQLTALPVDIFENLTALQDLNLHNNQLTALPVGIFDNLTALTSLSLSNNQLTALPSDIFHELPLFNLHLSNNKLTTLPDNIFEGSTFRLNSSVRLQGNSVDPLPMTVSLKKVAEGQFKATIHAGATFNCVLPLSVVNGSINGGATSITIPVGSVESGILTVTRNPGTTGAATVNIGALPNLPNNHTGYALVKSLELPLTIIDEVVVTNNAPVFTAGSRATRTIAENTAANTNIGSPITATDADNDRLTYTLSGADAAAFSIDSTTGQLRTKAALDYETKSSYSVTIIVSDGNGRSDSITVTINVTDVNENRAPVFTAGTSITRTIAENTAANTNIGTAITATDADNDRLTYTLGGTDAASFSIDSTTGQLRTKAALDYETKTSYTVTITVSDGSLTDTITVTIKITNVNEAPTVDTQDTIISLSPLPVQSPAVGAQLTLNLNIANGKNVAGYEVTLQFDATALRYVSSTNADYLPAGAFVVPAVVTGNSVRLAATSLGEESSGDGTLATITFEVVAVKAFTIRLTETFLSDAAGNNLEVKTIDGTVSNTDETSPKITNVNEAPTVDTHDTIISLSPLPGQSPAVGAQLTLNLNIANGKNVAGYQVTLQFDATALRYVSSTNADYLPANAFVVPVVVTGNSVSLAATSLGEESSGDGTLATITFEVVAVKAFTIRLTETFLSDAAGNNLEVKTIDGAVSDPDETSPNLYPDSPSIYWTDGDTGKIQRANLDGTNVENLITRGLDRRVSIALDVAGGKMYWTDLDTRKIQRANLDGTNVEDLITQELGGPAGIALDVTGGKMYWTNWGTNKIQRANLDGSKIEDLVTQGLVSPTGIALDVSGGKMYWTDRSRRKIQRANLDGSKIEDLVTQGLVSPDGIALDVAGGKMYWTDWYWTGRGTEKIQRANLNGSNIETLVTQGLDSPRGIALDVAGGKMYWTDGGTGKIQRANLNGSNVEDLVTGLQNPASIALSILSHTPTPKPTPTTNSAPVFTEGHSTTRSIAENTDAGENIGSPVSATDADNDVLTYRLGGRDAPAFNIDSRTGQLLTKTELDYETITSYAVTVSVSDGEGGSDTIAVTINVTDIDEDSELPVSISSLTCSATPIAGNLLNIEIRGVITADQRVKIIALYGFVNDVQIGSDHRIPPISGMVLERGETFSYFVSGSWNHDGSDNPQCSVVADFEIFAAPAAPSVPTETALLSNYPNPSNPETWIPYQLAKPAEVTIAIYNVKGQLVRTLALGHQPAGHYQNRSRAAYWDGRNAVGEPVASGVYFYTLTAGDFTATRKMLIRK